MKAWLNVMRWRRVVKLWHWIVACLCGWLVWSLLETWLAPKPVFELPLEEHDQASLNYGTIHIYREGQPALAYRIPDGTPLDIKEFLRGKGPPHPLTNTSTPSEEEYLVEQFSVRNTDNHRMVLLNPKTGQSHQFHENLDWNDVERFRPIQACILRKFLPFHLLAPVVSPMESPASILMDKVVYPHHYTPRLLQVVSIPNHQILGSILLDSTWAYANIIVSPHGDYVVCFRHGLPAGKAIQGQPLTRIWDVRKSAWIETSSKQIRSPKMFLNDSVFLAECAKSDNPNANGGNLLIHAKTGQVIDHLPSIFYSREGNEYLSEGQQLWYHRKTEPVPNRFRLELMHSSDSLHSHCIKDIEYDEPRYEYLVEGPQTLYTTMPSWKKWAFDFINKHQSFERFRAWLIPTTRYIHDWPSGRSYPVWHGLYSCDRSHDGKYLLTITGERDEKNGRRFGPGVAKLYRMPLTLYSPWWQRGAGLLSAFIILCCLQRWWLKNRPIKSISA